MTGTPNKTSNARTAAERRTHARQKIGSTKLHLTSMRATEEFSLDISEGGFSVQAAIPLIEDELPRLRFRFLSSDDWILGSGTIAWRNESKKLAGVSFVQIPEEARNRIRQWVLLSPDAQSLRVPVSSTLISKSSVGQRSVPITKASVESVPSQVSVTPMLKADEHREVAGVSQAAADDHDSAVTASDETPAKSTIDRARDAVPNSAASAPSTSDNQLPRVSSGTLKDLLVDESYRVRLHDLISDETGKLCTRLIQTEPSRNVLVTQQEFTKRLHRYEELNARTSPYHLHGLLLG